MSLGLGVLLVCGFQALPSEQGPGHSRDLSPDPCLISECKESSVVFVLFLFLYLEAVCSILKNKSSFDYATG